MPDNLQSLADAKDTARKAFEEACRSKEISESAYNLIRSRYMEAMRAHHEALGLFRT